MDVWSWICDLPTSPELIQSNSSQLVYQLTNPISTKISPTRSIQLKAEPSSNSSVADIWITFSICIQEFCPNGAPKVIWLSDPCHLSSDKPFLPLVLQLIQEIIDHAPITYHDHTQHGSRFIKLKPDPVAWILQTHLPESFSSLFNLILLTRLFWLCACDSPSDVGSLFFHSLLAPNLEVLSRDNHLPVLKSFMKLVGVDIELCLSRAIGYMLVKWLIVREMCVGLHTLLLPLPPKLGISYACETCGLWMMKGYAPVWAMERMFTSDKKDGYPFVEAKESALRYTLAHQQLEVHIQFEYTIQYYETYVHVSAHVDNVRVHVVKLGFNKTKEKNGSTDDVFHEELYFPSRVKFWVGPEIGSNYIAGLSLGQSTLNSEREIETQKVVKGSFGKTKTPKIKTLSRASTRKKMKNWRWDQDVDGNAAIFDTVLYDNTNGVEVYSSNLIGGSGNGSGSGSSTSSGSSDQRFGDDLGKRYSRVNRPFMKSGGLVFAGNEYGEEVKWRLSKEMEGSVLKWRIGGKVWLTYWPSDVETSYYETRCIELNDEVDLPLIPTK